MLSSSYRCQIYINTLYIAEGRPTTVNIFVGHNMSPAAINSKECAQVAYERDVAFCVCTIQNSKVMEAGYLQGSTKTINDDHWTYHFNVHPRFKRTDVQVKTQKIEDPTEEKGAKYNSRNQIFAVHIHFAEKDEQDVNIQMGSLYNKDKKSSKAVANLPEARAMRYVSYNATNNIAQTSKHIMKLQKNQLMQKWRLEQHHSIPFWGLDNIYKILTAPNGFEFTHCQVVMSIKLGVDYITPLFVAIDVSAEGKVVIICNICMKAEAERILFYLGIYVALVFSSVAWEAFTVSYKTSMEPYQYCPTYRCTIERDTSTIASDNSFGILQVWTFRRHDQDS